MNSPRYQYLSAARQLHQYLSRNHLKDCLLIGPDPGIRLNLRFWRFLKSYTNFLPWKDDYCFLQTQGYWCLANWRLFDLTDEAPFCNLAEGTARAILEIQQPQGNWLYPLPERRHLTATIEGNWAALALLETYRRIGEYAFLGGALRWHDFLVRRIGFQEYQSGLAINYFNRPRGNIPNNSTSTLSFLHKLSQVGGKPKFLAPMEGLLNFLRRAQLPTGEMPYVVESPYEARREHYLCYQYNAFQFLELAQVIHRGKENQVLERLARFISEGVGIDGAAAFNCFRKYPEVNYYTGVLGAALLEAYNQGLGDYREHSRRCFRRLLSRRCTSGGFGYSDKDYRLLKDYRSYPRYQTMILSHLLSGCEGEE